MKRVGNRVAAVLAVAAVVSILLTAPVALAGQQDFTLVNHTGWQIDYVQLATANSGAWGNDLLGNTVLQDEGRRDVRFSDDQTACHWDIRATFYDETYMDFTGINLCRVYKVILVCKDQGCWADTEE